MRRRPLWKRRASWVRRRIRMQRFRARNSSWARAGMRVDWSRPCKYPRYSRQGHSPGQWVRLAVVGRCRRWSNLHVGRFRLWSFLRARITFLRRCYRAAYGAEVLTQIPAKDGEVWFKSRRGQKITPASFTVTLFDETQTAPEPTTTPPGGKSNCAIKRILSVL